MGDLTSGDIALILWPIYIAGRVVWWWASSMVDGVRADVMDAVNDKVARAKQTVRDMADVDKLTGA